MYKEQEGPNSGKLKKAKNLAISMATKAASFARELKSIRSDLCFMQKRCALLEEENRRLRDGLTGLRHEEDDLVRLQLEALLLAEKSRQANENSNLVRENQCLHQVARYHQITSQDLSASFEQVVQGLHVDFPSPPRGQQTREKVKMAMLLLKMKFLRHQGVIFSASLPRLMMSVLMEMTSGVFSWKISN